MSNWWVLHNCTSSTYIPDGYFFSQFNYIFKSLINQIRTHINILYLCKVYRKNADNGSKYVILQLQFTFTTLQFTGWEKSRKEKTESTLDLDMQKTAHTHADTAQSAFSRPSPGTGTRTRDWLNSFCTCTIILKWWND